MKLNQVIALIQGLKQSATKKKTELYHAAQKPQLFQGLSRTYRPINDDGFVYPPETSKVVMTAQGLIDGFNEAIAELLNMCATQDWGNAQARADIKIGDAAIVTDVPVTHLLFLEKQLTDIKVFASSIPTLPIDRDWTYSANVSAYASGPVETTKTKKVTEFVVAYEATPEHPADVREVSNDLVEGTWSKLEFSGALPQDELNAILKRIDALLKAVTKAREEANGLTVDIVETAPSLLGYIFGDRYTGERAQA